MHDFSGRTTAYEHKFEDWKDRSLKESTPKALRTVKFLDVQWSDCPVEIEDVVRSLWRECELGNDNYIIKTTPAELVDRSSVGGRFMLRDYLIQQGVGLNEVVIIHWWW